MTTWLMTTALMIIWYWENPRCMDTTRLRITYLRVSSGQELDHLLHELLLRVTAPCWRGTGRRRSGGYGVLWDCASSCGGWGNSRHSKGTEAEKEIRMLAAGDATRLPLPVSLGLHGTSVLVMGCGAFSKSPVRIQPRAGATGCHYHGTAVPWPL